NTDFNNRVDECRVAGWLLQEMAGLKVTTLNDVKLREIPTEVYEQYRDQLPARFRRRADHFFTEQARVRKGAEFWANGDIEAFGQLMFESGASSIHQYESGIPEMITIYNILKDCPGVYGARFSGAGYRGAVIGLVDPKYKDLIKEKVDSIYPVQHPEYKDRYEVNFCKTADGASLVKDMMAVN